MVHNFVSSKSFLTDSYRAISARQNRSDRIHGTNRPGSIGGAVSHGCFRMHNTHIVELFEKVQVGANVYVVP